MKFQRNQDQTQSELSQAVRLLNENKLPRAKSLLEKLLKDDSNNMQLHYLLGIYYCKKENYRSAVSHLLRVIDSNASTIYMPGAIKILVFAYTKLGNYEIAQSLATDALEKYYEDIPLKNMMAYLFYESGDYKKALKLYSSVLQSDPENITALNGLGYTLIEKLSRYDEGLDFCLKALSKTAADPNILDSVGWAYFKLGEYKQAELYLKQAFEILPEHPVIKKHITMAVEAG